MKKYTIKEFAENKKAVKIENEEQWNKLNKVHKLCGPYSFPRYYTNRETHSYNLEPYLMSNWEVLEFSQLDFEDEFVVGAWYKYNDWYIKFAQISDGIFQASESIGDDGNYSDKSANFGRIANGDTRTLLTDLSEIQPFLPSNHPDLIKKDTFVLPEKWIVEVTTKNRAAINNWKIKQKYNDDLFAHLNYTHVHYDGSGGMNICHNERTITFEQFQKYVLKITKTMEKEIIGYKLIKPEYAKAACQIEGYLAIGESIRDGKPILLNATHSDMNKAFQKLKEAGVLDLWFEPVFKEEFKVGDWVELRGGGNGMLSDKRIICQLLEIDEIKKPSGHLHNQSHFMFKVSKDVYYRTHKDHVVRFATPEEIKAAQIQLPTINGYQGSYENGIIKYGCAEFMDSFFKNLFEMEGYKGNRTISSIELSSGVKITKEQIKQIVEYINNK